MVYEPIFRDQMLSIGSFFGWTRDGPRFFPQEIELRVKLARNRIIPISFKDVMSCVDFEESQVEVTKEKVKINLKIDVDKLIEKTGVVRFRYDEATIRRVFKRWDFTFKRPLFKYAWQKLQRERYRLYSKLRPSQIVEVCDFYLEELRELITLSHYYLEQQLSEINDKQVYGESKFVFNQVLNYLKNLRSYTVQKKFEFEKLDPMEEFKEFDRVFIKAHLAYLDFVLDLKEAPKEKKERLDYLDKLFDTITRRMAELGILQPVTLTPEQVESLIDSITNRLI